MAYCCSADWWRSPIIPLWKLCHWLEDYPINLLHCCSIYLQLYCQTQCQVVICNRLGLGVDNFFLVATKGEGWVLICWPDIYTTAEQTWISWSMMNINYQYDMLVLYYYVVHMFVHDVCSLYSRRKGSVSTVRFLSKNRWRFVFPERWSHDHHKWRVRIKMCICILRYNAKLSVHFSYVLPLVCSVYFALNLADANQQSRNIKQSTVLQHKLVTAFRLYQLCS